MTNDNKITLNNIKKQRDIILNVLSKNEFLLNYHSRSTEYSKLSVDFYNYAMNYGRENNYWSSNSIINSYLEKKDKITKEYTDKKDKVNIEYNKTFNILKLNSVTQSLVFNIIDDDVFIRSCIN